MANEAKGKLTLDSSGFVDSAKRAMEAADAMHQRITGAFTKVAAIAGTVFGGVKFTQKIGEVFKMGETFANASRQVGMMAGEYQKYQYALEKGVTQTEAADLLGGKVELMNKNAELFRQVAIKWDGLWERIGGFFTGIASSLAPALNAVLNSIKDFDLAGWGVKIGEAVLKPFKVAWELFQDGELWSFIGDAFTFAIKRGANAINYVADLGANLFANLFTNVGELFSNALINGLDYFISSSIAKFMDFFKGPIAYFQASLQTFFDNIGTNAKITAKHFFDFSDSARAGGDQERAAQKQKEDGEFQKNFADIYNQEGGPKVGFEALGWGVDGAMKDYAAVADDARKNFAESTAALAKGMKAAADEAFKNAEWIDHAGEGDLGKKMSERWNRAIRDFDASTAGEGEKNKYSNTNSFTPMFAPSKGDSMASVGGGGGVALGMFGLIDEAKKQTNLQTRQNAWLEQIYGRLPGGGSFGTDETVTATIQ